MVILTKFEPTSRICWFSVTRKQIITGTIDSVEVKVLRTHTRIYYNVLCDKEFSMATVHDWEAYPAGDLEQLQQRG